MEHSSYEVLGADGGLARLGSRGQTSTMEQLEQLETSIEGFRESGRARLGQMGWIG